MVLARDVALNQSDDYKNPTGAVIYSADFGILAVGANISGLGRSYLAKTHSRWCFRKALNVPSGHGYWVCPGCASKRNHAEARAARVLRHRYAAHEVLNRSARELECYLWGHHYACDSCLNALSSVRVKTLVISEDFVR